MSSAIKRSSTWLVLLVTYVYCLKPGFSCGSVSINFIKFLVVSWRKLNVIICVFSYPFGVCWAILQFFCHSEIKFTKVYDENDEKRMTSVSCCLCRACCFALKLIPSSDGKYSCPWKFLFWDKGDSPFFRNHLSIFFLVILCQKFGKKKWVWCLCSVRDRRRRRGEEELGQWLSNVLMKIDERRSI